MKKIIRIFIMLLIALAVMSPQPAAINASKATANQIPNAGSSLTVSPTLSGVIVEESDWMIECVECNKQLGGMSERSLQLDADGYPHIAYGGDGLYYAWYNGTEWHLETLDTNPQDVDYVSLALDSAGYAHIGYYDRAYDDIMYAFQTESGWQYQVVASDASSSCGGISALVLDEVGNPHISYGGDSLYYAHLISNTWQMIKIVDEGTNIYSPSLALDSQGFPHISYSVREACGPYSSELQYAYADSDAWNIETVPTMWYWADDSSLVIDANDRLHISYIESYGFSVEIGYLRYAIRDDTGWQIETVDDIHDLKSTSLAVDGNGLPHISYIVNHTKSYGADLMYAYKDEVVWYTETVVANQQEAVLSNCIALSEAGDPHISYLNETLDPEITYLMYTTLEADGWDFQTVDERFQGGQAGEYNSLALDGEDNPHISYYGDGFNSLKYARRDPAGWYTQTVESVGNFETNWWSPTSITLDLVDYPHISYSSSQLKYAYLDDSGWHTQTVAIDEVGRDPSLALDEQGYPHISYIGDDRRLKYAHLDQSGWQIQIVDRDLTDWDTVMSNSLALDKDNNPHISYSVNYLNELPTLNYAVWDGSSWQIEDIESGFLTYAATSLVLDAEGFPHISYIEEDIDNLKYAYQDASGWNFQLVDNGLIDRISSSLALDQSGYPHISYTYDDSLRYAFQDASGWQILTVDKAGVFEVSSLALDRYGYPHLSYHKGFDLMYAYLPAPERTVTIWPTNMQFNNMPGSIVTATLQVRNRGQHIDIYNVTLEGNHWAVSAPQEIGPLMAAEETTLEIQTSIPPTASLGSSDTATITLTSQSDPSITATAILTTYAGYVYFLPLVEK